MTAMDRNPEHLDVLIVGAGLSGILAATVEAMSYEDFEPARARARATAGG